MSDFVEYQVSEISDVQTGPFGSQLHMHDYVVKGTPIITVEHFGENRIIHQNLPLVSDDDKQRLIKYTLQEGDIVFSRVGSVDRRVYVTKKEDGWMFSGRCLRVRSNPEIVDGKFLSYHFGMHSFKEYIRMVAVGATMPSINTKILSDALVTLPPLPEQQAIAEVLSSLDDKIDLLHRNNKTLEEMAETLFRQWFVDEDTEMWSTVAEEFDVVMGQSPPGNTYNELADGVPFYQGRTDFTYRFPNRRIFCNAPSRMAMPMDTLLSVRAPVGDTNIAIEECCIGRGLAAIRHKNKKVHYSYTFLLFNFIKDSFDVHEQSGTVFGSISKNELLLLKCPKLSDSKSFNEKIGVIQDKVTQNCLQIESLGKLRDTLLPKLMSGQVRVKK